MFIVCCSHEQRYSKLFDHKFLEELYFVQHKLKNWQLRQIKLMFKTIDCFLSLMVNINIISNNVFQPSIVCGNFICNCNPKIMLYLFQIQMCYPLITECYILGTTILERLQFRFQFVHNEWLTVYVKRCVMTRLPDWLN